MKVLLFILMSLAGFACQQQTSTIELRNEKEAIIQTLELETRYFCERKLEKWAEQWSQSNFVTKMYAGDTEFKLFRGWEAIRQNTLDHINEHPQPIPIPPANQDYQIELFAQSALVLYHYNRADGKVEEMRLMIKEADQWKIARMETIYVLD